MLSKGEHLLFQKYYGDRDLLTSNEFWADALENLKDKNIALPMQFNPYSVRYVQELLKCEQCGECCRYRHIRVREHDLLRLKGCEVEVKDGGIVGPCRFLVDNRCSVYDKRPDVCWLFPIQGDLSSPNLIIRLKCRAGLNVIRTILTASLTKGDFILPNLGIVHSAEKVGLDSINFILKDPNIKDATEVQ